MIHLYYCEIQTEKATVTIIILLSFFLLATFSENFFAKVSVGEHAVKSLFDTYKIERSAHLSKLACLLH